MEYSISVLEALSALREKYGKEFLSVQEAAAELGLAYGSFRRMVSEGRAPVATTLIGTRRVVPLLGIAKLTYEALTGQTVDVRFGSLEVEAVRSASSSGVPTSKRPRGRPRKIATATLTEVRNG